MNEDDCDSECCGGCSCVPGPQGSQGFQGPPPNNGAQGDIGPFGLDGPQGIMGTDVSNLEGVQGIIGMNGTDGINGVPNDTEGPQGEIINGVIGDVGPQGTQGLLGIDGNNSNNTEQGAQGYQGSNIQNAKQGPLGYQGFQGTQGSPNFLKGAQGPRGFQGFQAALGTQGPIGLPFTNSLVEFSSNVPFVHTGTFFLDIPSMFFVPSIEADYFIMFSGDFRADNPSPTGAFGICMAIDTIPIFATDRSYVCQAHDSFANLSVQRRLHLTPLNTFTIQLRNAVGPSTTALARTLTIFIIT